MLNWKELEDSLRRIGVETCGGTIVNFGLEEALRRFGIEKPDRIENFEFFYNGYPLHNGFELERVFNITAKQALVRDIRRVYHHFVNHFLSYLVNLWRTEYGLYEGGAGGERMFLLTCVFVLMGFFLYKD